MTKLIIDVKNQSVIDWWYEADESYEPNESEYIVDQSKYDHRDIERGKYIFKNGSLVEDDDYDPRSDVEITLDRAKQASENVTELTNGKPVQRQKVSEQSKDEYRNASTVEEKADILFEILTGEPP